MNTYAPRQWRCIKITNNNEGISHYRIFATWGLDEWKLSSGFDSLNDVVYTPTGFEIPQTSGSVYILYKSCQDSADERCYWYSVYTKIIESVNGQGGSVERVFL